MINNSRLDLLEKSLNYLIEEIGKIKVEATRSEPMHGMVQFEGRDKKYPVYWNHLGHLCFNSGHRVKFVDELTSDSLHLIANLK